ncbi:MAG: hypothetical protein A4E49_00091 [Methanosaeta sp. PtaU1.Bin112]|nr:MAG: hypothetical protein A4E49_00091 [Methanosaeta sp. PtaU1.Bin112]
MNNNEGIHVKEARHCLLCGDEGDILYSGLRDRLFDAPGIWSLMQCPKCQLVWLNPRPAADDIGKLYANYFTHEIPNNQNRNGGLRRVVKASILQSSYGYRIDGANRVMGSALSYVGPLKAIVCSSVRWLEAHEGGRLLDVGCGNGRFLDQMRQLGWEVTGVEPDGAAVSVAREKLGLQVFEGSLEEARLPGSHFDAITMNHVIEHVPDPIGTLRECHRVLRPGGKLVVSTPNIRSMGFQVFGEYWRGLEVPRHLHLFCPQSLRIAAEHAGLRVMELRTTARSARWMYASSSCIRRDGTLPGGSSERTEALLRLQGLGFLAQEHGLRGPREAGEEIVMVAGRRG